MRTFWGISVVAAVGALLVGCGATTTPSQSTSTAAPLTVRASATWSGRFSVNGSPFTPIAGTVTAATVSAPTTVRQAQSILVPNPTDTG